jgi:hypothetical protein
MRHGEHMDMDKLVGQLESALRDEFERVGVDSTTDVGVDEETIVIAVSDAQAQAILDALYRAEAPRRSP